MVKDCPDSQADFFLNEREERKLDMKNCSTTSPFCGETCNMNNRLDFS